MQAVYLLIVTPILAIIFNVFKLPSPIAWYIPIFVMFLFFLRKIICRHVNIFCKKNIPIIIYFTFVFFSCLLSNYKYEAFIGNNFEGFFTNIVYFGFFYFGLKSLDDESFVCIKEMQAFFLLCVKFYRLFI